MPAGRCPPADRGGDSDLLPPSSRVLEEQGGAELGAVEAAMAARGDQGRAKTAAPDRPVQGRLADSEEPRRLAGGDQSGAVRLVLEALGESLDVALAEAPVSARRDERRMEQTAGHGSRNRRLADAEAGCDILRTDQSVQDV